MGLRISRGNMFEFVTHTWNPIRFRCDHDCDYCYVKKNKFHLDLPETPELKDLKKEKIGSGNRIFVGSSCDIWSESIPNSFLLAVIDHCSNYKNGYLFLTKNPIRYLDFLPIMPDDMVLGVTIESNRIYPGTKAPDPAERFNPMLDLKRAQKRIMVSIEPVMDFDLNLFYNMIHILDPEFVAIGANTNFEVRFKEPTAEKISRFIKGLRSSGTKVIEKSNLRRILK